jgi:hypothetical protein
MADRRSTYVFSKEDSFNEAKDHIYRQMRGDYGDSNKIYFYGGWGSYGWRVDVYSGCSDALKAADIFREHGGKFYDM